MKKITFSLLILFNFSIGKIVAQSTEASNEILFKIVKAGIAVKDNTQLNQDDLREIVCLTNISTKKWDGNFIGAFFFPSKSEIELWKNWFEENKTKITYSLNSDIYNEIVFEGKRKVVQVEFENGKFRNSVCGEDQSFQNEFQNKKKKD